MKARKLLYVFVLVAMILTACSPAATPTVAVPAACGTDPLGCAKIPAGQTIKIGMGAPMTGDNASYGIDISNGGKLAVVDAGDLKGWKFELVAQDDGGTGEGGAAVANKFVADPTVVAIAGHIFSGATAAAIPIYEKAGYPMMSPSATNPPLTQSGSKVFNRIPFTDAQQGQFAANYLAKTLNVKKLAILHDGTTYGKGLAEVVQKVFGTLGTVTSFDAITPGESDYTAVLSKAAANKPDAIYYGGYTPEAVVLENEKVQVGLPNVIFFGDDGTFGDEFLKRAGANGEGAYAAVPKTPPETPAKTKFDADYLAAYGKAAGALSPFTWNGYDVVAMLISVAKKVAVVGGDGNLYVPRSAMIDGVRHIANYVGVSGTYTCDATGECNTAGPIFKVVKGGAWIDAPQ